MPRFKLGERVALNGLLGGLHGGEAIGTVVLVVPDRHGMDVFDEYGIAFEDSRQLRVRSFQLTHVVLTSIARPSVYRVHFDSRQPAGRRRDAALRGMAKLVAPFQFWSIVITRLSVFGLG